MPFNWALWFDFMVDQNPKLLFTLVSSQLIIIWLLDFDSILKPCFARREANFPCLHFHKHHIEKACTLLTPREPASSKFSTAYNYYMIGSITKGALSVVCQNPLNSFPECLLPKKKRNVHIGEYITEIGTESPLAQSE